MNAINNPNNLPFAMGASSDSSQRGGDRPEKITVEDGPSRSAGDSATDREVVAQAPAPPVAVLDSAFDKPAAPTAADEVSTEEIEQLHVRFDRMETLLKRKLAVATLHSRFDALEAWLLSHFPN